MKQQKRPDKISVELVDTQILGQESRQEIAHPAMVKRRFSWKDGVVHGQKEMPQFIDGIEKGIEVPFSEKAHRQALFILDPNSLLGIVIVNQDKRYQQTIACPIAPTSTSKSLAPFFPNLFFASAI
jgi:hypothetical protein